MANNNKALSAANKAKKDEFYTQLSDIENELWHYNEHFKDKTVLCNCDDPYESNFFKYFAMNFNLLGLKKLICTCYAGSPIVYTQLSFFGDKDKPYGKPFTEKQPYKIEITEVKDLNGDGAIDLDDVELLLQSVDGKPELLKGNGDFRSAECIELLKEADIVVTNPPFSLFREYVAQLMEYNKKFIIIGNQNAITYKEIFPLLKDNKIWLGYKFGDMSFTVPKSYEARETRFWIDSTGQKWRSMGNICWFTNLDIQKRHENLILYKKYYGNESAYPKYDNYDAINVDKVADIPCDYVEVINLHKEIYKKDLTNQEKCEYDLHDTTRHEPNYAQIQKDATESWEFQSHSWTSTTPSNLKSSDLTDMSKTIHDTDTDLQSTDMKSMQEYSLNESCNGIMGVPITFMDKYNPEQFEILGLLQSSTEEQAGIPILRTYNNFREMRQDMTYTGASGGKANGNPVLKGKSERGNFLYNPETGEYVHSAYARITIKRKK